MGVELYREGNTHTVGGVLCEVGVFPTDELNRRLKDGWKTSLPDNTEEEDNEELLNDAADERNDALEESDRESAESMIETGELSEEVEDAEDGQNNDTEEEKTEAETSEETELSEEEVSPFVIMTDEKIRALAKEKGIYAFRKKSIPALLEELEALDKG